MKVADILALEQLGSVAASPDGKWLAVVIPRARSSAESYWNPLAEDVDHADIWLIPRGPGVRRNITNGAADQSGYWNPVWSPDGKRLAMLSTKGRNHIRPYVWSMAARTLRQVATRDADLGAYGDESFLSYGMIWSDSTTLLCPLKAENTPGVSYTRGSTRPAHDWMVRQWEKTQKGLVPSVSVLESGREMPEVSRPKGQLVAIDSRTGNSRVIVDGNFRQVLPSPSGRHLALIAEVGRIPPKASRKIPYGSRFRELWRTRLFVLSLPDLTGRWMDSIIDPKLVAEDTPHSWSPDGSALALIAKREKDDEAATLLWVISSNSWVARKVADQQLDVSASAWSLGGALLARASRRAEAGQTPRRFDWWNIVPGAGGSPTNLTGSIPLTPDALWPSPDPKTMLGIVDGALWSVDAHGGMAAKVTGTLASGIESLSWPTGLRRNQLYSQSSIVRARDGKLYQVEWAAGLATLTLFPTPVPGAELLDFRPKQRLTIFASRRSDGTYLWTGDGGPDHFDVRLLLNPQVARFPAPKRRIFRYRGVDGDSLSALLLLPPDYQPGKRYPIVTWVYPDWVVGDSAFMSWLYEKQQVSSINLVPLISRGVGVLIPSLPLPPEGEPGDPYLELPKGVMPAVDKAVELGIADPDRLALMGLSFGGYATYSLLTYTHRFKAAVAMAGLSNLVSSYGEYFPGARYYDGTHEELFAPALAESGQIRMDGPPWRDLFRYMRNSPISFVDRVQTPLMIIQGDMDYVPIRQGEEFFNALYRLGKEAKFVRYWGEGHTIESPANIQDMWNRIFDWLDQHFIVIDKAPGDSRNGAPGGR